MTTKSLTRKFDKLVRIDLDFSKTIDAVAITGDFFLHPEDTITKLEDALVGLNSTDYLSMEEKLSSILEGCTLVGFTVDDLVSLLKEMTTITYRFIPYQKFSAAMNMALDEAIAESVKSGESNPTIRVYGWDPCAISIGYFQGLENEVNTEKCERLGIDVVRRRTGGGAVYHDDEITYSVLAPQELFPEGIIDSYREICSTLIAAFEELDIVAEFAPINDIVVTDDDGTKKISGNAQTRRSGILQQHGTILYSVDVEQMFSLLKVSDEKIADKLIQSVKKRVTSVSDQSSATFKDVLSALQHAFAQDYSIELGDYTDEEVARAKELVVSRYGSDEWTAMR